MKISQKNWMKNSSGITLIALVITIIVLLILAGVSLSLIMGNDGILGRAENAVGTHTAASVEEEVKLLVAEAEIAKWEEYSKNPNTDLSSFVKNYVNNNKTASGATVTVDDNGKLEYALNGKTTSGNLDLSTGEVTIAGATTGGTATSLNGMYSIAGITEDDIADESLFNVEPIATSNGAKEARITLKNNVISPTEDNYYNIGLDIDTFVVPYEVQYNGETYKVVETDLRLAGDLSGADVRCVANIPAVKELIYPNTVRKIITSDGRPEPDGEGFGKYPLESVVLSNQLENIPYGMFWMAENLKNVTIPNSVTTIETCAFLGCEKLTSIEIPSSVTSIDTYAFSECTGLTSVTIPSSVSNIVEGTFDGCRGLTSVTIEEGVTTIGDSAFSYCSGLTSIEIPNSVTSIGRSAFSSCSGLTSIEIPNSVTSIGSYAFSSCTGLTSIEIPNSVTSIEIKAFAYCTSLKKIYIPSTVTTINSSSYSDNGILYDCSSSCQIYTNASAKQSGWGTYWNNYSTSGKLNVNYGKSVDEFRNAQ